MVRRSNNQAGSVYHLSSLRYAEGGSGVHEGAGHHLPSGPLNGEPAAFGKDDEVGVRAAAAIRAKVDRFAEAENSYRAGHSSSSSLLLRSGLFSISDSLVSQQHPSSSSSPSVIDGVKVDRDAIEGFHRTKARSLLAQTVPSGTASIDGASLGGRDEALLRDLLNTTGDVVGGSNNNSLYYLPNRKAKHPLSRDQYERERKVRRLVHDRARKRAKQEDEREKASRGRDGDENEEDDDNDGFEDLTEREQEQVDRNIKEVIEETHRLMPSGTLLETIHYLASHYYDARGKLSLANNRSGEKEKKKARKGDGDEDERQTNLWRAFESNALVALGIYLEEMIKHEAGAAKTSKGAEVTEAEKEETSVMAEKLAQVQGDIRRRRRRTRLNAKTPTSTEQSTKKRAKGKKHAKRKRIDVGWALPKSQSGPSRRQAESSSALDAAGDDDDDSNDNDSDENDDRSSQGNGSEASSEHSSTSGE